MQKDGGRLSEFNVEKCRNTGRRSHEAIVENSDAVGCGS
jgi:hypothetical protein